MSQGPKDKAEANGIGIKCTCGNERSFVIGTKQTANSIKRIRECTKCSRRFETYEREKK